MRLVQTRDEKGTTGRVAGGAFDLPLPDAMPLGHPPNAEMFASCFGSGADAAIACPCQVANSIRFDQGITSFVSGSTWGGTPWGPRPRESAILSRGGRPVQRCDNDNDD